MASNTDHGDDFEGVGDLTPAMGLSTGRYALAESIARRTTCPPGDVFGDQDFGKDSTQWLNTSFPQDLSPLNASISQEAAKDERVTSVDAQAELTSVEFDEDASMIRIRFHVIDEDGLFEFTVASDELTREMLLDGTKLSTI